MEALYNTGAAKKSLALLAVGKISSAPNQPTTMAWF
jgi:hypothetical protein